MIVDSRRVRLTLRRSRKLRWLVLCLLLMLAWHISCKTAPDFSRGLRRLVVAPFGVALQLTTVAAAFLPVLGLTWFVWHLFFRRRVRLQRLRRIRVSQGRSPNLLAPPPLFGAAYRKTDHGINRDRSE